MTLKGDDEMSYLEILSWACKGIRAEQAKLREMQDKALEGQAMGVARYVQEQVDVLDVKLSTLEELAEIHNRK